MSNMSSDDSVGNQKNSTNKIKIVQINVNHCRAAKVHAPRCAAEGRADVIAVQEVYITKSGEIAQLPGYRVFWTGLVALYVKNKFLAGDLSMHNTSKVVAVGLLGYNVTLLSVYCPPNDNIKELEVVFSIIETYIRKHNKIIIMGDFNCRTLAVESGIRPGDRTVLFEDFVIGNGLALHNVYNCKTFANHNGASVVDYSITDLASVSSVTDWQVTDGETLSDHHFITFNYKVGAGSVTCVNRNYRRHLDGEGFLLDISDYLFGLHNQIQNVVNDRELDLLVQQITDTIKYAIEQNTKVSSIIEKNTWWTPALQAERKEVNRLRRLYQSRRWRGTDDADGVNIEIRYKTAKYKYRFSIVNAKNEA